MTLKEQISLLMAMDSGSVVEWKDQGVTGPWRQVSATSRQVFFDTDRDYRIKPKPRVIWVDGYSVIYTEPLTNAAGWTKFVEAVE